jgi:hypothetical protein
MMMTIFRHWKSIPAMTNATREGFARLTLPKTLPTLETSFFAGTFGAKI